MKSKEYVLAKTKARAYNSDLAGKNGLAAQCAD